MCWHTQAEAANLLSTAIASAAEQKEDLPFPVAGLASVVEVAQLSPAEPASQEAMSLLANITNKVYGKFMSDMAWGKEGYHSARPRGPSALGASELCARLTQMRAANAALAHLKHLSRPAAVRTRGRGSEEPRVSRAYISRFASWICEGPGVFQDMHEHGLLEILMDMLRSSDGDERAAAVFALGALAMRHDAARGPLRALGAIRPLTQKLQVGTMGLSVSGSGLGFG
jgi:hypothetical protein